MDLLVLLLTLILSSTTTTCLTPDGLSLLAFKSAISTDPSSSLAAWNDDDTDPCRWPGISCSNISGSPSPRVVGIAVSGKNLSGYIPSELGSLIFLRRLNLHGNRLSGSIPTQLFNATSLHSIFLYDNNLTGPLPAEVCNLPRIQNLDLSRNSLSGPVPADLRSCRQLQRLLLSQNRFSGQIPPGIWPEMLNLVQLDLSSNNLSGPLPPDIGYLNSLSGTLNLSHNRFSGKIPSSLGNLPATVSLDLRSNNLSGEIPQAGSLANQGPTAFLGNQGLCGFPLQIPCDEASPASPSPPNEATSVNSGSGAPEKKGLKPGMIMLISVCDAAGVALVGLVLVYIYWKLKDQEDGCSCTGSKKLGGSGDDVDESKRCCACWRPRGGLSDSNEESEEEEEEDEREEGEGRLVSMEKGGFKLELDELLRASAYVLGKSGMGIVYKVVVGNGVPVAVRRLGEGGGQRYKEFAAEVQAIGRVRHPNVVRLRAYYWAPDEKLLVTDFIPNGNLASALRGKFSLLFVLSRYMLYISSSQFFVTKSQNSCSKF